MLQVRGGQCILHRSPGGQSCPIGVALYLHSATGIGGKRWYREEGHVKLSDLQMWCDLHGRALLPPEDRGDRRLQVELLPLAALRPPPPAARPAWPEKVFHLKSISRRLRITSTAGKQPPDPISRFPPLLPAWAADGETILQIKPHNKPFYW